MSTYDQLADDIAQAILEGGYLGRGGGRPYALGPGDREMAIRMGCRREAWPEMEDMLLARIREAADEAEEEWRREQGKDGER